MDLELTLRVVPVPRVFAFVEFNRPDLPDLAIQKHVSDFCPSLFQSPAANSESYPA